MGTPEPQLSIVIPCYNAESYVATAVTSALAQDPAVEVIVVNDGSTDSSLAALQPFRDRIVLRDGPQRGAPAARNTGLAVAQGAIVVFLDADDFYKNVFVGDLARAIIADSVDAGIGNYTMHFPDGREIVYDVLPLDASQTTILRAWAHALGPQTAVVGWRRSFLNTIGGWRTGLLQLQDNELGLRAGLQGAQIRRYDYGYLAYQLHTSPHRVSAKRNAAIFASLAEALNGLDALSSASSVAERRIIGEFAYTIACRAFRADFYDEGRHALAFARHLGFRGHVGRGTHRLGARLLGLETKERLSNQVRRWRSSDTSSPQPAPP